MSEDFENGFLAGMKAYDNGDTLNEFVESEPFCRGYKARQLEDELEDKLLENTK